VGNLFIDELDRCARYGAGVLYDFLGVGEHLEDAFAVLGFASFLHDPVGMLVGEGLGVVVEIGIKTLEECLAILFGVLVLVAEESDRHGLGLR
jgi:putative Mn2+ efflux pump MntP